ncbi:YbgC/FadM family acyl-CoA thioesterase [uncultured Xylophilus sp.]|uniref:YbgC/FadM family acyl-CoA thioesterase n=1 Tax=uncultured Xylophilus sp. TaxID=296832 RepID=UPI0025FFBB5E|nr:YbgC/FadM family acyl-CoA thioesterase [uncultured Xylophilus sp.]
MTTTLHDEPPEGPGSYRFFHRLRVRWAEVDMQKVVFNAHYLMYLDTAIADYWRALALPYEESMVALGGDLFVRKSTLDYHTSARLDDMLDIGLRCRRIGGSSLTFDGGIYRAGRLLAQGEIVYVFADPTSHVPCNVPEAMRSLLQGYEAGEPVTALRIGDWEQLGTDAAKVRTAVFVQEQNVPEEEEWDEDDATAVHVVVYNRLGMPLATGRLLPPVAGVGRIGRMAVHRVLRGCGVGRVVLETLIGESRRRGDTAVELHAQRSAEGFYDRAGFQPFGDPFDEVGIPHIGMRRIL